MEVAYGAWASVRRGAVSQSSPRADGGGGRAHRHYVRQPLDERRSDVVQGQLITGNNAPLALPAALQCMVCRRFFVCLVTVVWKLGQTEPMRPSCMAEELATHILMREAEGLLDQDGVN